MNTADDAGAANRLDGRTATLIADAPPPACEPVEADIFLARDEMRLPHRFIDAVEVVSAQGHALTEGADYALERTRGAIAATRLETAGPVRVRYRGGLQRVDLLIERGREVELIRGPEIRRMATLFAPAVPDGARVLHRILRWPGGMDVCSVPLSRERLRADGAPDGYEACMRKHRPRLAAIRARLARGGAFRLGAYGDSVTEMSLSCDDFELNLSPNGPRDRIDYFEGLGEAEAAALFDPADLGDGLGATAIREGMHWRAIRHVERAYGVRVAYRNWGVKATRSEDGANPRGHLHGAHPLRLAAVAQDGCDLVHVAFGTNELGSPDVFRHHVAIGAALLKAGSAVIFITPGRRNPIWQPRSYARWLATCAEIERAADALGVACVQTADLFRTEALARLGMAEIELAEAGLRNHMGPAELNAVGDALGDLLAPAFAGQPEDAL
ncbi:MAG: hypothetical protein IT548_10795 [Alphaproteobacteria bacterium]|nr:hypothetical protein [Alphaproteobacteria bacterium]